MAYYYRGLKKYDDAYRMTEKAILKKRSGDIIWAHFVRGLIEIDQGRWDLAEEELRFVLDRNPTFPRAHSNLSQVLRRKGEMDNALIEAEKAIEVEPTRARGYLNKAWSLIELKRVDEAQVWFEKAIAVEPDNEIGHLNLADHYRRIRQLDLAVKHYRLALDIKPNLSRIYANLAGTLRWWDTYKFQGDLALLRGDEDSAMKLYEQSNKLNSNAPDVLAIIAWLAQAQGNQVMAQEYSQKAVKLAPYIFSDESELLKNFRFLPE